MRKDISLSNNTQRTFSEMGTKESPPCRKVLKVPGVRNTLGFKCCANAINAPFVFSVVASTLDNVVVSFVSNATSKLNSVGLFIKELCMDNIHRSILLSFCCDLTRMFLNASAILSNKFGMDLHNSFSCIYFIKFIISRSMKCEGINSVWDSQFLDLLLLFFVLFLLKNT